MGFWEMQALMWSRTWVGGGRARRRTPPPPIFRCDTCRRGGCTHSHALSLSPSHSLTLSPSLSLFSTHSLTLPLSLYLSLPLSHSLALPLSLSVFLSLSVSRRPPPLRCRCDTCRSTWGQISPLLKVNSQRKLSTCSGSGNSEHSFAYRGTSLIRNRPSLAPYSRFMPRALSWS